MLELRSYGQATKERHESMTLKRHNYIIFIAAVLTSVVALSSQLSNGQSFASWSQKLAKLSFADKAVTAQPQAKPCTKLRAPQPPRNDCNGKLSGVTSHARSRSNDDDKRLLPQLAASTPFFWNTSPHPKRLIPLGGWLDPIRGPTGSRAAFWSIHAISPRMRN